MCQKNQILNDKPHIAISAKNDTNALLKAIEEFLNSQQSSDVLLNSTRQIMLCERARDAIKRAENLLEESQLELFAYEINLAISSISQITKPFQRAEILDEMFSNFCLGK